MKKAIVTGPSGAVGTSLIRELIGRGIEVTAVFREGSPSRDIFSDVPGVQTVACSLDSIRQLPRLLNHDYDAFYHFAWDGTYGNERQDYSRQAGNIVSSIEAARAAEGLGCTVFIGAGSQSEFGRSTGKLSPEMPCFPDNGYSCAKLAAGQLTRLECEKLGLKHIWCRIFSTYGCNDKPYTLVMSTILRMLKGERVQFTAGDQIWDFLYNKDCARAFRLAAEKGQHGGIYCLGSGQTRRLRDFITAIRDAVNP
ncbi:MAG: NAD(P)-dependent oxidoreductase [Clostridia bacterium]|nr:NAD(P)-dependent oxidoreductase [Clostridia bacterium]